MRILLFGKAGQVGWELQRSLAPLGELISLAIDSSPNSGDFADLPGLISTIRRIEPDVIVNAVAYTAVDTAEEERDIAHLINAEAPAVVAREAKRLNAWLIHYSTDYVFNGEGNRPWSETDQTGPLNHYGATKLAGDQAIHESGCQYLNFRTSWVYATRGNNFAKTMLRLAGERASLNVIDDQTGAPTGAELLADVTAHALQQVRQTPGLAGLYHLSASGETTWYRYARFVLAFAQTQGLVLKAGPDDVYASLSADYSTAAQRPLNSRLNTQKLQTAFGLQLPDWQNGVSRMLTEVLQQR